MNPVPGVAPVAVSVPTGDPSVLLWVFFWAVMILTILLGFGLLYHWFRYGHMYPLVWVMMPIYAVGVLVFIGAMLAGIAVI